MEFSGAVLETGTDVSTVKKVNWIKHQKVCVVVRDVLILFIPRKSSFSWPLPCDQVRRERMNSERGGGGGLGASSWPY